MTPSDGGGPSLISAVNAVLRYRHILVLSVGLGFGLAVGLALWRPRTYTSRASFMPQAPSNELSRLSGLAMQFGVAVPVGPATQTPFFYVDLLQSREILGAAVDSAYAFQADTGMVHANLLTIFGAEGKTPAERREDAVRKLREKIATTVLLKSGVVLLNVTTAHPALSQQIGARLFELLDRFNAENRQSQASAERRFVEQRLKERQAELQQSEDRQRRFLEENRNFQNSPALSERHNELQRDVMMRQTLVTSLSQSYEQARIDEVRDTPVITLVQRPDLPVDPDRRHLINKALVGMLLGGLFGLAFAWGREFIHRTRRSTSPEAIELGALKNAMLEEVRHPLRSLRRDGGDGGNGGEWEAR